MMDAFRMSNLGLLRYYLGIEVRQGVDGISITQTAYANKILEQAGMVGCNPCHSPMESRLKLSKKSTAAVTDTTAYRSLVGSLRYLVHTRPDLAYSVGYVSRFMETPTVEHLAAVKHNLRYIAGTRTLGCYFPREPRGDERLVGFSDSDMAGDVDDRKSTSGVMFFLGWSPISWYSVKQKVVPPS